MPADLLTPPAADEAEADDTAVAERRTVIAPPTKGRPGWVSVTRPFTPEERARYQRAVREEEAAREENVHVGKAIWRTQARGSGVAPRGAMALMKLLRTDAGVSLTDLAAKAGMQKSSLSRLENEDRNPTVRTLERIAAALGKRLVVRVEDLPEEDAETAGGETPAGDGSGG